MHHKKSRYSKQLFKAKAHARRFPKVLSTPYTCESNCHCVVLAVFTRSTFFFFSCRRLYKMTIQFSPGCNIAPNQRGELQIWIESHVDRDTDFYIAVVSEVASKYVMMRAKWHKSKNDKEEHLTGNVIIVRCETYSHSCIFNLSHSSTRIMRRWVRPTSTEMDRSQCSA